MIIIIIWKGIPIFQITTQELDEGIRVKHKIEGKSREDTMKLDIKSRLCYNY